MRAVHLLLICSSSRLFAIISAVAVSESCYNPAGGLTTDTPCNTTTTTGHSACCRKDRQCTTAGLCFDHGLVSRGSCTDPTFADDNCPKYCVDWNIKGGCAIVPRKWYTNEGVPGIGWCCEFPRTNGSCPQGFEIKIEAGLPFNRAAVETTKSVETTSTSASVAQCTSANTATSIPNDDASGVEHVATTECAANHDVAIGVGVGVPALIAIISLLGLWLWERRRRSANKPHSPSQETSYGVSPYAASYEPGGLNLISPLSPKHTSEMDGAAKPGVSEVAGTPTFHSPHRAWASH